MNPSIANANVTGFGPLHINERMWNQPLVP